MGFDLSSFLQSGAIVTLNQNTLLVGFGTCQWMSYAQIDPNKPAFYFPDFFLQARQPWVQYDAWQEMSLADFKSHFVTHKTDLKLIWYNSNQKQFYQAFEKLQGEFACSRLQKAVPYIFSHCANVLSEDQLQHSLCATLDYLDRCPFGYLYGFWQSGGNGLLGVTPELLFEYDEENASYLSTMALAGTCPKDQALHIFQRDPKQLREHRLAVNGICNSLQKLGKVNVEPMRLLELPTLAHLMTPIAVQLSQKFTFESIVHVLHPTPALGTYPREEGWSWLKEYNSFIERGRYGAPAGFIHEQQRKMRCVVAIRNVQWNEEGMRIGAGCGVIQESQCEEEWKEICLKTQAIRELLAL